MSNTEDPRAAHTYSESTSRAFSYLIKVDHGGW
jgi:hypothetical protein